MATLYLNDSTFALLRDLIHHRTGSYYEDNKKELLADKLEALVTERGFDSFLDYYYLLKYDDSTLADWQRVQNAISVNETYFGREYDQIQATAQVIVPQLQRERIILPVRIWHAACSSGEEPYTMAMALNDAGCFANGAVEIIASDVDTEALAQARAAVYRDRSFRVMTPEFKSKYFTTSDGTHYRLNEDIRRRVRFEHINLMDSMALSQMRNFDIIFCRNVFIYFTTDGIKKVVEHFHRGLNQPGYLFVAASESLLRVTTLFELSEVAGAFTYKK